MEVITYSLRAGDACSDSYYCDVAALADRLLGEAESRLGPWLGAFETHERASGREPRTRAEYTLDLLTLGVLWRVYAARAQALPALPGRAMAALARLRERSGRLKPVVDPLRSVLAAHFLWPAAGDREATPLRRGCLLRLQAWLTATGDFDQAARRLHAWRGFLATRASGQVCEALAAVAALADWFEAESQAALGRYTAGVEPFLARAHPTYRGREDAIFCGRQRVEYHLCMVGTEILNRAFRQAFLATTNRLVLLPPCMRPQPDDGCRAQPTPLGARCAGCTQGCRVHELTRLGEEFGFRVLLLPGELAAIPGSVTGLRGRSRYGIVGVSCVLTNANGGWEARALNLPAQGVPLDYCGCRWHWHRDGFATDVNVAKLLQAVGVASGDIEVG